MASKILMVEDDKALQTAIQAEFEVEGMSVVFAGTTGEGLKKAQTELPDLIMLDLMLPDGDGLLLLEKLKTDPKLKGIPVVVLTNFGDEDSIRKALDGGAEDFLLKYKTVPAEIAEKVKKVIGKSKSGGVPVTS